MTTPIQFRRATRAAVRLKLAVEGPAGSGKTWGALAIASGICEPGKRVFVADTENGSASFYANEFDFDSFEVPDSSVRTMAQCVTAAVDAGAGVLVIDSLSHVWLAILEAMDQYRLDNPRANHWVAWGMPQFGKGWNKLMKHILDAPIPIIATMRSKTAYEQQERDGKKEIVKLGAQAQVREGADYEFGLMFTLNHATHRAEATKDRTHLFEKGLSYDLADPKLHKALLKWMNTETPATHEDVEALLALVKHEAVPDVTRQAVMKAMNGGVPGADKVAKWTVQLRQKINEAIEAANAAAGDPDPDPNNGAETAGMPAPEGAAA